MEIGTCQKCGRKEEYGLIHGSSSGVLKRNKAVLKAGDPACSHVFFIESDSEIELKEGTPVTEQKKITAGMLTEQDKNEIERRYMEGQSYATIIKEMNLSGTAPVAAVKKERKLSREEPGKETGREPSDDDIPPIELPIELVYRMDEILDRKSATNRLLGVILDYAHKIETDVQTDEADYWRDIIQSFNLDICKYTFYYHRNSRTITRAIKLDNPSNG